LFVFLGAVLSAVDSSKPAVLDWIPNAGALSATTHALHEYIGRLWYRIRL